mmetsp:Transcript_38561/g.96602  ORF Transcript_38561/g.96602 Transcript_38561/m.96602 type:complete len:207 (-) Transcript_38561:168-788(-)
MGSLQAREGPRLLQAAGHHAAPQDPLDRVLRRPRPRQHHLRAHHGRYVCAAQHCQHGRRHRRQRHVRHAVRRRLPPGPPHRRVRALRLRRRARRAPQHEPRVAPRELAAQHPRRAEAPPRGAQGHTDPGGAREAPRRAQRHRAVLEHLQERARAEAQVGHEAQGRQVVPRHPRTRVRPSKRGAQQSADRHPQEGGGASRVLRPLRL